MKKKKRKLELKKGVVSLACYGFIFMAYLILLTILVPIVGSILQLRNMIPINLNAVAIYVLVALFIIFNILMYIYEIKVYEKNFKTQYFKNQAKIIIKEQIIIFFYINNIIIFILLLYNFAFDLFFSLDTTSIKEFVNQDLAPFFDLGIILGAFITYKNNSAKWVVRKVINNKIKMFDLEKVKVGAEYVKDEILEQDFKNTQNVLRGKPVYRPKKANYTDVYFKIFKDNTIKSFQTHFEIDCNKNSNVFKSKLLGDYCYNPTLISNPDDYIMFMQINFNDIVSSNPLMPTTGILQIFITKDKDIEEAEIKVVYNEDSEANMIEYLVGDNEYRDYIYYSYILDIYEIYEPIKGRDFRFDSILENTIKNDLVVFNNMEFKYNYDKFIYTNNLFISSNMLCYINTSDLDIVEGEVALFQIETLLYDDGRPLIKVGGNKKIYILILEEDLKNSDFSRIRIKVCN